MRKQPAGIVSILVCAALATACADSDADVTEKIKSEISTDRAITSATNIQVSTHRHVVTLSGTAENRIAKDRAVTLARQTRDVSRVVDNLTVAPAAPAAAAAAQPPASTGMDDAAITTAVRAKLAADGKVPADSIDVDTKAGVVTLKGTVKSEQEKQEVLQVARDTQGVVKVEDLLTVKAS
jgi:hyperosmotically inducible protein